MRYAIIQSGGKQYRAVEGQAIEVDKLDLEVGKKVELGEVMLVADGNQVLVGKPTVADAKVAATVVSQDKGEKISVFKYKPKIRYRVKTGHRQLFTRLMIESIDVKGLLRRESTDALENGKEKARSPREEAPETAAARRRTAPTTSKPKAPKAKAPAKKKSPAKASTPKKAKPKAKKK
jgi:large subunit ribosomal protein L21